MSDKSKSYVVSRNHFSVVPLGGQSDKGYWKSRTIEERLEHLQFLRWMNYGEAEKGRGK